MDTMAVVLEAPERLVLRRLDLAQPGDADVVVDIDSAASAPAPSGCCGPAGCRRSPAWAIRWCPATNRSAA